MSDIIKVIKENFSWMKDVAIVGGIAILLFLNARYVSVEKFDNYQKANELAHQSIQTTLGQIDKTLALQVQNNDMLVKASEQIRINTIKIAEIDIRVKALEAQHPANGSK